MHVIRKLPIEDITVGCEIIGPNGWTLIRTIHLLVVTPAMLFWTLVCDGYQYEGCSGQQLTIRNWVSREDVLTQIAMNL